LQKHQTLNDLYQILSSQNIEIKSMKNKTNRLEALFIRLIKEGEAEKKEEDI
jgi:ABC-2 type transport system ATP-binding protein